MKLRNKKTGEIVEREEFILIKHIEGDGGWQDASYHSLAELNEEWEDYKPTEPLIKDEKVRKAVRAWAKTVKAESAFVEKPSYERADLILSDNFASISFPIDKPKELDFCKRYTIEELCGEE